MFSVIWPPGRPPELPVLLYPDFSWQRRHKFKIKNKKKKRLIINIKKTSNLMLFFGFIIEKTVFCMVDRKKLTTQTFFHFLNAPAPWPQPDVCWASVPCCGVSQCPTADPLLLSPSQRPWSQSWSPCLPTHCTAEHERVKKNKPKEIEHHNILTLLSNSKPEENNLSLSDFFY